MNKKIKNVWCIAVCLIIAACTGEDTSPSADGTPLQVELQSLLPTRTTITGTTLPDGSQYGIYVAPKGQTVKRGDNGFNIPVSYKGGKSTMSRDYILQPATDYNVYAAYPQENNSDLMTMQIETASKTDYLYGYAIDNKGGQAAINQDNYIAKIQLRHAMALLKFNIFQSEENKQESIVTGIRLVKAPVSCTLNLQNGERTSISWSTQIEEYKLTINTTPQTVQMLVLPNDQNVQVFKFCVNGKWIDATAQTTFLEGNSYNFNVEIQGDAKLFISEATITPRDNTIMDALSLNVEMLSIGGTIGTPVDLGLSVKWADHNIGASNATEVGGQYMWGDPTGLATTNTYNKPTLSDICGTQYDIAKTQWGGRWMLPSREEVKELKENTKYEWTTINGVEGALLTSLKPGYTNKSIFFPWYGTKRTDTGVKTGSFWVGNATPNANTNNTAWILHYQETELSYNSAMGMTYKNPVRAVYK